MKKFSVGDKVIPTMDSWTVYACEGRPIDPPTLIIQEIRKGENGFVLRCSIEGSGRSYIFYQDNVLKAP